VRYKTCNKCGETSLLSTFPIKNSSKDGRYGFCVVCKRAADKESRSKRACSKEPIDKKCTNCEVLKKPSEFSRNKTRFDGLHDSCKLCKSDMAKDFYARERDQVLKSNKAWRDNNKDILLPLRQSYYAANKSEFLFRSAVRRVAKIRSAIPITPCQEQEIKDFYWLAQDLKTVSGQDYHVDHIVPLQGKNVCGLHVPWNLQVLPSDINLSKGNRYADDA